MTESFSKMKRQFEELRNEIAKRHTENYNQKMSKEYGHEYRGEWSPDYQKIIGYPAAIAALLDGMPIATAKEILTAAIGVIEGGNRVVFDEIYKNLGSYSCRI